MTEFQPTRVVDGATVPAAGTWTIDPLHSSLAFEARHFVVNKMRGRFRQSSGQIVIAERPADSTVEVTIDAASVDTIHPVADEHLRGDKFLDVAQYPTITFRSTHVHHVEGDRWRVAGDLTIHGVTRPVTLDATFNGAVAVPRGVQAKLGFSASTEIDRRDYGITTTMPIPTGGVIVGNEVRITLDVEADLAFAEAA